MVKLFKLQPVKDARLCSIFSLAFFLSLGILSCKQKLNKIALIWEDHLAIGLSIPKTMLVLKHEGNPDVKIINATSKDHQNILGSFNSVDDAIIFKPLIPFTPGLSYQVWEAKKMLGTIKVDLPKEIDAPQLLAIYPKKDTVPENLLKFYFHFSRQMISGESLNYIHLLASNGDTLRNVFLNLQPELWDTTGTVLTIWIDPGRIKTNLVLNQKLGLALKHQNVYQLIVNQHWRDKYGLNLAEKYTKTFVASIRDDQQPDVNFWNMNVPKANTKNELIINVKETLDHYLLKESIVVIAQDGKVIEGNVKLEKDQFWQFTPKKLWKAQIYKLKINARLEDLAANNFNKVFDRDVTKQKDKDREFVFKSFEIKP